MDEVFTVDNIQESFNKAFSQLELNNSQETIHNNISEGLKSYLLSLDDSNEGMLAYSNKINARARESD